MGEASHIAAAQRTEDRVLKYVPLAEVERVRRVLKSPFTQAAALADIVRLNAWYMIRFTGSGHPGSSFSSADIVTWLFTQEMTNPNDSAKNAYDIYFSSKGHDVPVLYALLIALGKIDFEMIHKLRRLGGLPGHPDVHTPGIAANTGSLGMGISKARGMAYAKRLQGKSGRIYVLTGDGELQEGQIWESLQPTANGAFSEITVIVDHNKIQSDIRVKDTSDLGVLEEKFRSFGWEVVRCDGHDVKAFAAALAEVKKIKHKPQVIIADTIKGKGVSFMERLGADGLYKFHSGAPSPEEYHAGFSEMRDRVNKILASEGVEPLRFESREMPVSSVGSSWERLVSAYGDELIKVARDNKKVVAMDADLVLDTGLIPFKKEHPERYVECGIAEQDMVSMAGGMALKGVIPIVHSFECFLSTRANEHFYNNATERTKIVYTGTLAGLLPGMPGHSHQSVRGISVLGAIPGLTLVQPCNEKETRLALRWAVGKNKGSTYIRLTSIACECPFSLPEDYTLEPGKGVFLLKGKDIIIFAYGPLMTTEAIKAAKHLAKKGVSAAVVNFPWLNRVDEEWLRKTVSPYRFLVTLDDHYVALGQGMQLRSTLAGIADLSLRILSLGLTEVPSCGHNAEVLKHHKLDFESIAKKIQEYVTQ